MAVRDLSSLANRNFKKGLAESGEFKLALGNKRLSDIIDNKMRTLSFDVPASAYTQLSPGNQRALTHLVKAAVILDIVYLKQDHPDNIRAREELQKAAAGGNKVARASLTLFNLHNGLEGHDMYAKKTKPLRLFSDKKLTPGRGFYPQDITKKELVKYVLDHPEQASAIFSNNTIVKRDGDRLVAVPYSVAFRDEMEGAARELLAAARETDHEGLAQYLRWQAQALVNDSDPEMLFNADKHWVDLEDSPLEFTIGRESYDDRMTGDVAADPKVKALMDANRIKVKSKDILGVRVGIVNKESYAAISNYRQHLKAFANQMPLNEVYKKQTSGSGPQKMTFADVDLVAITGRYAAVRGGMTVAQNLPNDDKLSVQLNQGNRLVFHRQVRQSGDPAQRQKFLDALIDPAQHQWYDANASFLFTLGHEVGHSLGPKSTADGRDKKGALGKWGDIIEECKADLASLIETNYFVKNGKFTPEQANKIYLTWAAGCLPIKRPLDSEAHRQRSIMQINYFREKGAIQFEKGGKLSIISERMVDTAREMLTEVIQIQLDGDPVKAESFVKKYAVWNDALQYAADEQMKDKPKLYRLVKQPLRDSLSAISPAVA